MNIVFGMQFQYQRGKYNNNNNNNAFNRFQQVINQNGSKEAHTNSLTIKIERIFSFLLFGTFSIYLSCICRTGVPCNERLADEHIDAVRLADSQCCTSALRRASSSAISVSLDESQSGPFFYVNVILCLCDKIQL